MKLLKQICQHEQALQLREIGIVQDQSTYFLNKTGEHYTITHTFIHPFESSVKNPWVAVFTVAELGEILPKGFASFKGKNELWFAQYHFNDHDFTTDGFDNEASARAALLIDLLTKGMVSRPLVNNKLNELANEALFPPMRDNSAI